jgi:hypothetical protein
MLVEAIILLRPIVSIDEAQMQRIGVLDGLPHGLLEHSLVYRPIDFDALADIKRWIVSVEHLREPDAGLRLIQRTQIGRQDIQETAIH